MRIYVYLRSKFVYFCVTVGKVCLPVKYLRGPFKTLQGITVSQSSVSVCDLIVSGPKETTAR